MKVDNIDKNYSYKITYKTKDFEFLFIQIMFMAQQESVEQVILITKKCRQKM